MDDETRAPGPAKSGTERPKKPVLSLVPRASSIKPADPPERRDELSVKIIQPLLGYMRHKYGAESVHQIAVTAGLSGDEISKPTTWVSHSQFEQMLF